MARHQKFKKAKTFLFVKTGLLMQESCGSEISIDRRVLSDYASVLRIRGSLNIPLIFRYWQNIDAIQNSSKSMKQIYKSKAYQNVMLLINFVYLQYVICCQVCLQRLILLPLHELVLVSLLVHESLLYLHSYPSCQNSLWQFATMLRDQLYVFLLPQSEIKD